ncbi:uncharacterized protein LOC123704246 isoform X2 [Colias croceus]|uniref:uncharacterized protein LOC123704246 isoform X2 n=1 Tax=Colias crocea TaxID=72248 RepID=UPI001E27CBAA|nr:uncharacterized protein LOC123704246 isoform X2 [Colias croceus]
MKPLLQTVVVICLLIGAQAHPENIEDVKELPQTKEPVVEAEESEPSTRVERCSTCGPLKINSPKEVLAALQAIPGSEVHTQQSFEGCSSEKGCAGVKVKDGQVVQRYGNSDAFKAAEAADVNNEFNFLAAGALANPFWWMSQDSPFKTGGNFQKFSKQSSSYTTAGAAGNAGLDASLNLAGNPFLNGEFANAGFAGQGGKPGSSFQSSSFESSYSSKGDLDLSKNPFLNGGFKGQGGLGQNAFAQGANSNFGGSNFASQSGLSSFGAQSGSSGFGAQAGQNGFAAQGAQNGFAAQGAQNGFAAQGAQNGFAAQGGQSGFGAQGASNSFGSQSGSSYGSQSGSSYGSQSGSSFGSQSGSSSFGSQSGSSYGSQGSFANGGGYTGSSPRPFAGTPGVTINTQKSEFDFDQQQQTQQNIDELFQGSGNVQETGDFQQTCAGQGYICVPKAQCNNGVVSGNGANLLQARTKKQYCNLRSEICCRLEVSSINQGGSFNQGSIFGQSSNSFGSTVSSFVPVTPVTPIPDVTSQNNFIETDSFSAGSEANGLYRPGSIGSGLKPGIPYLPPVDSVNSGTNLVSTTAFTPIVTTPRPIIPTVKPYIPPVVTSTSAPGYLPPIGEQTINRETIVPNPVYNEGSLILDETRPPKPTPGVPFVPNEIPAGCAAALKCTPVEFCTAEGVISNTSVVLTRDQDAYRVPLTDCRDIETGRIGKCCRDPYYTDPWPTNQLGKWVPGVFGGNDGKYVPDSRGSSNNVRPVTPPTTGSVLFGNFRTTPKPTVPSFGSTPRFPTTVTPFVSKTPGQGQFTKGGQGQFTKGGQGQIGSGSQVTNAFSKGQFGQGGIATGGQGELISQGQGQLVSQGQGQLVSQGQGSYVSQGQGQLVGQGGGQYVSQGKGQYSFGSSGQYELGGQGQQQGFGIINQAQGLSKASGQLVSQGQGQAISQGKGQIVSQGKGQIVSQGKGQIVSQGKGQIVSQGNGQFVSQGNGQFVSQGNGQIVSQGKGQIVTQGQGTLVSQGGGSYIEQGEGQTVSQGFGTGFTQGQGFSVSQGSGFGVENEYQESVQRVFLQRYNGAGQCGILNPQKPYGNKNDLETDFAEIPWQAMVLLQTNRSLLCGGVITRPDVVVTSAACVDGLDAKNVLIKGGEWKLGIDDEPLPFQIVQVKTILRHPFYRRGSLLYDAAILVLSENLRLAKNINPICLPSTEDTLDAYYNGAGECVVTGWGKIVLQAHIEGAIMHSMNVSLINPGECQAKLSSDYPHLLEQYNEDACVCGQPTNPLNNICKVDIGSALACTSGDGRYVMRGVYSWDSGCQVGNQIASFYKFDLEWYEWAIGLIESVRFSQYTKVTTGKYTGQINGGVKGSQFGSGIKTSQFGGAVKTSQFGKAQFGSGVTQFGGVKNQGAISGSQGVGFTGVKGFAVSGKGQFGFEGQGQNEGLANGQFGSGQLSQFASGKFGTGFESADFNSQIKSPITSNAYSATYSEKKVFQTEPKIISFTTKPEIVTYTTKPEIFTYTTKPKIITYTTKPKIITYTTKPKIITYTTKPQIITYETSGSGTNPQYVAPGVTFNPSFSELVGAHSHTSTCKCLENK